MKTFGYAILGNGIVMRARGAAPSRGLQEAVVDISRFVVHCGGLFIMKRDARQVAIAQTYKCQAGIKHLL